MLCRSFILFGLIAAAGCSSSPNRGGRGGQGTGGDRSGGAIGSGGAVGGGGAVAGSGGAPASGGAGSSGGGSATGGGAPATGGRGGAGTGGRPATGGTAGSGTGGAGGSARDTLDIYWVDVEGGAATLLVSPSGQSLLVDGGFPGNNDRDLNRVLSVLNNQAHLTRLDYVITTHYHVDHVGGVTALASRFPVGQFIDHGATVETGANYNDYVAAIAGKTRVTAKPGDRLPFGDVELLIVSAGGNLIDALPTAIANPNCAGAPQMPERPTDENAQSVGFIARFGTFDFVDLGDLTWAVEDRLACPTNRLGTIDLLQVSHHGLELSSSPQLVHGLSPLVAVMNNGAAKGGAPMTWETLKSSPGIQDIWALHRVAANDAAHNAIDVLTANVATSPDAANIVRASVARDGSYTVVNARNGETRTYQSK